jgi:cytochrome c556
MPNRFHTRKFHTRIHALPATLLMLAGTATVVAASSPAEVITARQAHYKDLGKAFKAINEQLKSPTPDLAVIQANAPTVTQLGQQQNRETWFPAGTQAGQGLQTEANAAIWKDPADFNVKRADFAKASADYADIAAKGDLAAIQAATAAVGKTCKGCHETYRDKDKS